MLTQIYKRCNSLIGSLFFDFGESDDFSSSANFTSIPGQYLHFIPISVGLSTGPPHWITTKDDSAQYVDVKRQKLFPIQSICMGLFLFAFAMTFLVYFNARAIDNNAPPVLLIVLNLIGVAIAFLMSAGVVGGYAWMCYSNSQYWKGTLYFRYKLDSQELFFSRENHVYRQNDCKRIILGCIIAYDTRRMTKVFGIPVQGGNTRTFCGSKCQCFVLILTDTDEWKRYEIGYDLTRSKKQFNKLVSILQPLTNCEVFYRKYSLLESFDEQHGKKEGA